MANVIPVKKLGSTNYTVPVLGFGTATHPLPTPEETKQAVLTAIKLGYRHFDTAHIYQTEKPLGDAISEALSLGLIKSRSELFITSKLWATEAHPERVLPAIKTTLKKLGTDYVDLYLIHWPVALKPETCFPIKKDDLLFLDFKGVWESMEECQRLGLAKSIGVSNFSCKKLETLLSTAKIPPALVQVEINPVWQQKKLREFCKERGISVEAYSPLGGGDNKIAFWVKNRVGHNQVLKEIAEANGKSLAQICLRWLYEQGVSFVAKSFNEERLKQNMSIFDWELSAEDLKKIEQIPQAKGNSAAFLVSEAGPYKTVEEFWDGEI